jgi:2-polyprenyl-3-methyl-5-hydroxy-6-metoxy-1,4-benzoquinol methylase
MGKIKPPSDQELQDLFRLKYGEPDEGAWGPSMRRRFGYYTPDDYYEALLNRFVRPGCTWLDVGCGRDIFPSNQALARILSRRCGLLVGVDPDATLEKNTFVHEKVRSTLDDYRSEHIFDLVTLRMVAEHVEDPPRMVKSLSRCTRSTGLVVIYTVNRFSPIPLITSLVPFRLHHPVKQVLWRSERRDTFPTSFRMNTRRRLRQLLTVAGFEEVLFTRLDDCRTFSGFRPLQFAELMLRTLCHAMRIPYPEYCLLAVYQKL